MVILANSARMKSRLSDPFFNRLAHRERPYIIRQSLKRLKVSATKSPLHIIFLPVSILIEHRGQVGNLVMFNFFEWLRLRFINLLLMLIV